MWKRTEPLSPANSSRSSRSCSALLRRPGVAELLAALNTGTDEARVVGGAVRDALMGHSVGDIDIATTVLPETVMKIAQGHGWKAVPTGIEHGTVTIIIAGIPHEVTTLRRDVETDGRRAVVAFSRDFREDALRRDFTINALSLSEDGVVHDYATGRADAQTGVIRFMGDAESRIREDYLRILRFFRFHASHGTGEPDETAIIACGRLAAGMTRLSRERVRQELLKLLAAPGAADVMRRMDMLGITKPVFPDINLDIGSFEHLMFLEQRLKRPADAILRLAALLGGAGNAKTLLKLSNAEADRLAVSDAFAQEAGTHVLTFAAIRSLVFRAGTAGFTDARLLGAARHRVSTHDVHRSLRAAAPVLADPPVDPFRSAAAITLGVLPGPRMGRVLKAAADAWLGEGLPDDPARQADILAKAVRDTPA
jgi:poly(A) polymerase